MKSFLLAQFATLTWIACVVAFGMIFSHDKISNLLKELSQASTADLVVGSTFYLILIPLFVVINESYQKARTQKS